MIGTLSCWPPRLFALWRRCGLARYRASAPLLAPAGRLAVFRHVFWPAAPGSLRVPLRTGCLSLDPRHDPDWRVFEEVFVRRVYATDYRDAVVVDVGAHRGLFAAFALASGAAAVHAYEPAPDNFAHLRRTLDSFAAPDRARACACAVTSMPGTTALFTYDQSWSHSLLRRGDRRLVARLEVESRPFAGVLAEASAVCAGTRRLIVKIDTEGSEYDILTYTPPAALAAIDELFLEIHDYAGGGEGDLLDRLRGCGLTAPDDAPVAAGRHRLLHLRR